MLSKTFLPVIISTALIGVFGCVQLAPSNSATPKVSKPMSATSLAPNEWQSKNLPEIAAAIAAGDISSEELTQSYLDRIETLDRVGPRLQSIISINPDALEHAREADAKRAAGEPLGVLHGVPILIKDNIETKDNLPTTAGSFALRENYTGRDAPLVEKLRGSGAIILGKTNLSQWANFRSETSISGWSAVGGQVKNPHILDRNPCGSSSGSGAAAAASLAAGTVGTETNGSIICPSNANGIVGFKPTVGLVSQQFIVPISASQDTAGPMTKSVKGAAMMLTAMATREDAVDYAEQLDEGALKGARVGVLRYSVNANQDIVRLFEQAIDDLRAAGAVIVEIDKAPGPPNEIWSNQSIVLEVEFKAGLNKYLSSTPEKVETRSLDDLIAFNEREAETELALFDQSIFISSNERAGLDDPAYLEAKEKIQSATRANGIDKLKAEYNVDILVSPSGGITWRIDPVLGDVWPYWTGANYLAAISGYPAATVPMGKVHGIPLGLLFIGSKDTDAAVLSYAYAYEQATRHRSDPQFLQSVDQLPEIAKAVLK